MSWMRPVVAVLLCLSGLIAGEPARVATMVGGGPGAPVRHGLEAVTLALVRSGWEVRRRDDAAPDTGAVVIVVGSAAVARLRADGVASPQTPEAQVVRRWVRAEGVTVAIAGGDEAGLMYALLELAEQIRLAPRGDPLSTVRDGEKSPAVTDRVVSLDLADPAAWVARLQDEAVLVRQLDALAAARFNRVRLVPGTERGAFPVPTWRLWRQPRVAEARGEDGFPGATARNRAVLRRFIALARERGLRVTLALRLPPPHGGPSVAEVDQDSDGLSALLAEEPGLDGIQLLPAFAAASESPSGERGLLKLLQHVQRVRPTARIEVPVEWATGDLLARAAETGMALRLIASQAPGLPDPSLPAMRPDTAPASKPVPWPRGVPITLALGQTAPAGELPWGGPDQVSRCLAVTRALQCDGWDLREPAVWGRGEDWAVGDFLLKAWGSGAFAPTDWDQFWRCAGDRGWGAAAPRVRAALELSGTVLPLVVRAVQPPAVPGGWWAVVERSSLGRVLADYAARPSGDAARVESLVEAARRILVGGVSARQTPEETIRQLEATAEVVLAEASAAEAAVGAPTPPALRAMLGSVRSVAWLARFHARRIRAAVHYNLFLRGQKLAELVAATFGEKDAVAAWRELVALAETDRAGSAVSSLAGPWRQELKRLEQSLRELEDMCCPPDEAVLREKVWSPIPAKPIPWRVDHVRPERAVVGRPLRLVVRVPGGPEGVRIVVHHAPVGGKLETRELTRVGAGEHAAELPIPESVNPRAWTYHFEMRDAEGRSWNWPALSSGSPSLVVPVTAP